MYIKAAILALVVPLACATIQLQQPTNINSDSPLTVTWSSTDPGNDPASFSLELLNTNFHDSFAVANNVQTALKTLTITLPSIPKGDGYSLEAINISNITDVYSKVGPFSVGAPVAASTTASSGTAKGSGTSVSATTFPTQASSSGFGSTVGASATSFAPSGSSAVSSSSASKASSASGSSPSNLNGAMSHSSSSVTLALSAFAGVALLAL
ncbi:hypothetical protein APHAL10511_005088 [Amanita phalloides]|nr:hypothetical protein APHAL10511_005088 [Amanita phalloides]